MKECKSKIHEGPKEIDESNFCKHPKTKDKLQIYCKDCMRKHQKKWWENNKEVHNKRVKRYKDSFKTFQSGL